MSERVFFFKRRECTEFEERERAVLGADCSGLAEGVIDMVTV
jgi:hypothetical protein